MTANPQRGELGDARSGHVVTIQGSHERAAKKSGVDPSEFLLLASHLRHAMGGLGMDKYTVARLMAHSSPRVLERYYIHITESHVVIGSSASRGM